MSATIPKQETLEEVLAELYRATKKCGPFASAHEGYAVIKEEFDELWDVIKLNQRVPERADRMRKEATQVAAMALRFLHDICDGGGPKPGPAPADERKDKR